MLPKNASLRHIALKVNQLNACEAFYHLLGLTRPSVYVDARPCDWKRLPELKLTWR